MGNRMNLVRTRKTAACVVMFLGMMLAGMLQTQTIYADDLDFIEEYVIEVEPDFTDGSMYMTYYFKWLVLDSESEGPLEWVKIGIPNQHAEEITALSENIEEIDYFSDDGDYVRIDFDRAYYEGEVVEFSFSVHQHQLYELNDTQTKRNYIFVPGWFDECEVEEIIIKWSAEDMSNFVTDEGYELVDGEYVVTSSLSRGEKISVTAQYEDDVFEQQDETFVDHSVEAGVLIALALIIVPIIIIAVLSARRDKISPNDYYDAHSGMGSARYHHTPRGGGRVGGGGCACACACACAGGGRAGCSKKDFYGTKNSKHEQEGYPSLAARIEGK